MKVLLTGACGRIGVTSLRRLLAAGHEVRCFETRNDYPSHVPGFNEALAGLRAGEVDAITSDMLILQGLKLGAEEPEAYRIAGERFSTEPYGIAVRENQSEFRDALNAGIERLWKTGRWQRVYEDWFGKNAKYRADEGFKIVPFPE